MTSSTSEGARSLLAFFPFFVLLGVAASVVIFTQQSDVAYSAFRSINGLGWGG